MKEIKTLRLEKDLIDAVKAKAESEHRTFTNMVTCILEEWRKKETKAA
jgi:hypothetical protein